MAYKTSAKFDYRFEQRSSSWRRFKRSVRYKVGGAFTSTAIIVLASVAGLALTHFAFFYAGVLDEAVNYNLDAVYQEAGVAPTRDNQESRKLDDRIGEYRDAKKIMGNKEAADFIGGLSEEEKEAAYRKYKQSKKDEGEKR